MLYRTINTVTVTMVYGIMSAQTIIEMHPHSFFIASSMAMAAFARSTSLTMLPILRQCTSLRRTSNSWSRILRNKGTSCLFTSPSSLSSSFDRGQFQYHPSVMMQTTALSSSRIKKRIMSCKLSQTSFLDPSTLKPVLLTNTRLFGCNPKLPNAQPGNVYLSDERDDNYTNNITSSNAATDKTTISSGASSIKSTYNSSIPINLVALQNTIHIVREIIGYPTYDVSLTLVNDSYMQQLNTDSRGIQSPTDVLSFSLRDSFVEPGVLKEERFDREEYYDLGELFIDVDYVQRRCEEDRALHAASKNEEGKENQRNKEENVLEGEVVFEMNSATSSEHCKAKDEDDDDANESDEYEYGYMDVEVEDEYYYEDEYDDRGVAPAMQYIYDPEIRIHMLVVHGMLHLVGYDHETDDDYELMVVREDEVLAELKRRLGEDFGLQRHLPLPNEETILE